MSNLGWTWRARARRGWRRVEVGHHRPAQTLAAGGSQDLEWPGGLRLISWNLAKKLSNRTPLAALTRSSDIVCVQEATPAILPTDGHTVHFAESFRTRTGGGQSHGLATLAQAHPVAGGSHAIPSRWREGWVMTPKMVLSTEFAVGSERLLVINVHAYNFQPVFKYMLRDQFERIHHRVSSHPGPAVVCGDFNTWRIDRYRLIERFLEGFAPVEFGPSAHRKGGHWSSSLVLGKRTMALDHVFVRGLMASEAEVLPRHDSDHGALAVRLHLAAHPPS